MMDKIHDISDSKYNMIYHHLDLIQFYLKSEFFLSSPFSKETWNTQHSFKNKTIQYKQ